jgi:hypothetical protein
MLSTFPRQTGGGSLPRGRIQKFVGSVRCVSARGPSAVAKCLGLGSNLAQASPPLPAMLTAMPARFFASEVILIIRLPARPSRLKVTSMPTVLRKVWQRRSRAASARGFVGQAAVLLGAIFSSRRARRRSEACPAQALRSTMISRTKLEHFPVALNQGDSQVLSLRRV